MKTIILYLLLSQSFSQANHADTLLLGRLKDSTQAADQRVLELLKVEAGWNRSTWAADTLFLQELLHPNFVMVSFNGKSYTKTQTINFAKDRRFLIHPFKTEDVVVRFFGNTAVVTGIFTQRYTWENKEYSRKIAYTDVYLRTRKKWQALSAHATLLPG